MEVQGFIRSVLAGNSALGRKISVHINSNKGETHIAYVSDGSIEKICIDAFLNEMEYIFNICPEGELFEIKKLYNFY